MGDKNGELVARKHAAMKGARVNWDSHWDEVAEYYIPRKDDIYGTATSGEKKHNKLFTSVTVQANEKLSTLLHGSLTNPADVWFGLKTGIKELDQLDEVKRWLQDSVNKMLVVFNRSNFNTQVHQLYLDLGSFGTGYLRVLDDDDSVVRFESRPIYEAYLEENFKGIVDTVSYEYEMTLRQIVQEFGEEVLDKDSSLRSMFEQDPMKKMIMIHLVEPRDEFRPEKINVTNLPWRSTQVIQELQVTVSESGFHENPNITPRWTKISGEKYGRSPAMKSLSDGKMLNAMQKVNIQGAQKVVDPPLQAPDDGFLLPIRTNPGGINYYRAGSRDRLEPLNTGSRPDLGEAVMATVEERIKQAFFIDEAQVPLGDRATATEVIQRRDEQLRKFGPVLGRLNDEFLRPLIDRVFGIMMRKNMFSPAPGVLQDVDLQVEFVSQIAKAQKTANLDDLTRTFTLVAPLVETKPSIVDNFDQDFILRDVTDKLGLPVDYLLDQTEVGQLRLQRAQLAQQQQQQEEAAAAAEVSGELGG